MLKPDLVRAYKERKLPFIGTRAHLISALVRESAAENAVPGEESLMLRRKLGDVRIINIKN